MRQKSQVSLQILILQVASTQRTEHESWGRGWNQSHRGLELQGEAVQLPLEKHP